MFLKKGSKKKLTSKSAKRVAAATAVGLTTGVLLAPKIVKKISSHEKNNIGEVKNTLTEQAEALKSRMQQETDEIISDVQNGVKESAAAIEEINATYKKAKHEMKKMAKDAQQRIEEF